MAYNEKVIEHFEHSKNVGTLDKKMNRTLKLYMDTCARCGAELGKVWCPWESPFA